MTVEELQVLVTARTRGLEQQMSALTNRLQGVQRQSNTMGNNMTRVFSNLKRTLIALGIGKAIKAMFDMSRTYEAATQQVNRIFRENAGAIEAWIQKNATTFGMARADAMQYASVYGNLVKGFEKDTKRMSQYTTQLLEATTVIASNTGRTVADVSERIRSGLLGNTEAIEDLGIYANVAMIKTTDAFKTIANGRTWEQLAYQEQQQIRLMSILEQSAAQFGTSIQQNTNYQLMQLTANLKNIALNLGNAFMPIVSVVLPCLNAMALALANVTAKLAAFMNALFGTSFNTGAGEVQQVATGAGEAAQGYSDMADSADKAGDSAKKAGKAAKNALMGFDEVNQLQKDSGGGSGGAGGGGGASPITSDTGVATSNVMSQAAESFATKVEGVMDRLKNLFKEGFEIGLGGDFEDKIADIKSSIEGIKTSLKDIFTDPEVVASAARLADSIALNLGKISGSVVSVGATISQNLLGGVDKYLDQNKGYIKERLIGIMDVSSDIATLAGDFSVAFADIFSVFGGETGRQVTANIIAIFSNAFLGSLELALRFGKDILSTITQPIIDNKDQIKEAIEKTLVPIEGITATIAKMVTETYSKALEVYKTDIAPAVEDIKEGNSNLLKSLLEDYDTYVVPVLDGLDTKINDLYEKTVKPTTDKLLESTGKLSKELGKLWKETLEPMLEWISSILAPIVAGAFKEIEIVIEHFVKYITDIVNNISKIFEGLSKMIDGAFSGDWNKFWEGLGEAVSGAFGLMYELSVGKMEEVLSYLKDKFANKLESAKESIKLIFSPLSEWFGTNVIEPIKQKFGGMGDDIKTKSTETKDGMTSKWSDLGTWFGTNVTEPIKQKFSDWKTSMTQNSDSTRQSFNDKWKDAGTWFGTNVTTPIKQKFEEWKTGIGQASSNAYQDIQKHWSSIKGWFDTTVITPVKQAFQGLWNDMAKGCKDAVNGLLSKVESGINNMASKVNSVTSKVGINIPSVKVPKLARGGIVDSATFMGNYVAGEAGKEMIVPLENTAFVDKLASSLGNAVMYAMSTVLSASNGFGGDGSQNLSLEMDGTVFARTIAPLMIKEFKRLGIDLR